VANATELRDEDALRRVRHLGSARKGLWECRLQRQTALALIPLGLYFVASMLRLTLSDQRLSERAQARARNCRYQANDGRAWLIEVMEVDNDRSQETSHRL
jgi:hypothetical protein